MRFSNLQFSRPYADIRATETVFDDGLPKPTPQKAVTAALACSDWRQDRLQGSWVGLHGKYLFEAKAVAAGVYEVTSVLKLFEPSNWQLGGAILPIDERVVAAVTGSLNRCVDG